MRRAILAAAIVGVFAAPAPAFAEDPAGQKPSMRIDTDEAHKAFVFVIDDKPVALLDKEGLHVREGIVYGATLNDAGSVSFDKRIDDMKKEAAHD